MFSEEMVVFSDTSSLFSAFTIKEQYMYMAFQPYPSFFRYLWYGKAAPLKPPIHQSRY